MANEIESLTGVTRALGAGRKESYDLIRTRILSEMMDILGEDSGKAM